MLSLVSPLMRTLIQVHFWLLSFGYFWMSIPSSQFIRGVMTYGIPVLSLIEIVREACLLWIFPKWARRLEALGRHEKALALMRRSVRAFTPLSGRHTPSKLHLYAMGLMCENAGRHGEASEIWSEIASQSGLATGFEAGVRGRLANSLEQEGDLQGAIRQRDIARQKLERATNAGRENWSVLLQKGKRAREANDFSQASAFFQRAFDDPKPRLTEAQRPVIQIEIASQLAVATQLNGEYARAASAARQVAALATTPAMRAQGWRLLSNALLAQNSLDEALEATRAALAESQKLGNQQMVAHTRAQCAHLLLMMGHIEAALRECEIAIALEPDSARFAFHAAANCHSLQGNYGSAREYIERAPNQNSFLARRCTVDARIA